MAGGDLLYIFAFIILPTAVLVSCIWALIMLRKGVLLPERPAVVRDVPESEEDAPLDETNLVEETGEHIVVEPATPVQTPAPVATTSAAVAPAYQASPTAASDEAVVAPLLQDEPPVVEQTQELTALSPNAEPVVDPRQRETIAPAEAAAIAPVAASDDANRALPDAEAPDLLMVPLDEVSSGFRTEGGETAGPAADQPQAPPATATPPRRPARRMAQRRPTEAEPSRPRPRTGQRRSARRVEE